MQRERRPVAEAQYKSAVSAQDSPFGGQHLNSKLVRSVFSTSDSPLHILFAFNSLCLILSDLVRSKI